MKKKEGSKTEEMFKGICIAKHNDYYNSTFTIRCVRLIFCLLPQNIAGEAVTVLFSTYQPDIKSVRVCLKINIKIQLIQESFLHKAQRKTHKSKLYYLKDKPILDIKIPNNWIPERKYVDKEKNNQWLISRGKKPEEQSDLWGFDFVQFSVSFKFIFVIHFLENRMWLLFYLLIWTISLGSNTDKDISSVYSLDEYNGFFNVFFKIKVAKIIDSYIIEV